MASQPTSAPPQARQELARWIAEYVTQIAESTNLDEAHHKKTKLGWAQAYRRLKPKK